MIQRSLLSNSRALSSKIYSRARPSFLQQSPSSSRSTLLQARLASPSVTPAKRWYSEAAEARKEENKDGVPPVGSEGQKGSAQGATGGAEEALKKEIEAKNKEVVDLKDKYLRSVADFRNLQERTKREVQAAKDFALQRFAKDLIDSVDNLDRALTVVPAERLQQTPPSTEATETSSTSSESALKDLITLHDGLKMTETILMGTLKKHGLERFDPSEKGDKFDPNVHEATFQTPQPGKQDGTVFFTQSKGFLLNGRVIRPAKVGVVKNS